MDSEGIKRSFEREVIGDTPKSIEEEVGRVIDWIVERNHRLWQDISGYIERRQLTRHHEGMIGDVGPSFGYNRQALLDSIGRVSREVVGSYNREAESRTIANEIQGAFATTALAEAGALGLGTIVVDRGHRRSGGCDRASSWQRHWQSAGSTSFPASAASLSATSSGESPNSDQGSKTLSPVRFIWSWSSPARESMRP